MGVNALIAYEEDRNEIEQLRAELERVKAERDKWEAEAREYSERLIHLRLFAEAESRRGTAEWKRRYNRDDECAVYEQALDEIAGENIPPCPGCADKEQIAREALATTLDCGDNSCLFSPNKRGMRTNGGCRCFDNQRSGVQLFLQRSVQALRRIAKKDE